MATETVNESAKDARERRQAEEVNAWIELDTLQKAAEAQIAALDAQGALTPEQEAAKKENAKKVSDAQAQKAVIENAYVKEYKCPVAQFFSNVDKAIAKEKAQRLVESTNGTDTQGQLQDLRTEFVEYVQDKETVGLAAQHLLDAGLLPSDLKGGKNVMRAASAILPANLAADFRERLKVTGSDAYNTAIEELGHLGDTIQPIYDGIKQLAEAARDLEKGVIVGRTADAAKEVLHNPAKLGKVAVGLLGAWALFSAIGGPSDEKKGWIKGILGALGVAVGASAFIDSETFSNISPKDWIEKQTGHRMDEIFSTPSMDSVRHFFDGMPTTDTDAVDDMIRVVDANVTNCADMFRAALTSQSHEVDTARLLGHGLDEKEFKYADKGSLYTAMKWMFLQSYEVALSKGEVSPATTEEAQCSAGMEWAKRKNCKVGTLLVELEIVKTAGDTPANAPILSEGMIGNRHLDELASKNPAFGEVLEPTDQADVYLINGYPVRYNYTDSGGHTFTDASGANPGVTFVEVAGALNGDGLKSTLLRIATEAETAAQLLYARVAGIGVGIKYNNKGDWILNPPEPRVAHAGLANYLTGPNDPKVPVILYFDGTEKKVKIGMDSNGDGVPEKRATPYNSIQEVADEFEKGILHDRIATDTSMTLLLPFTVESYQDVGTTTEVNVTYGGGIKGKMIYEADAIKSYTLGADAELSSKWTAHASDVCKTRILGDPRVQAALLRGTTEYTGYNSSTMDGLVSKFVGLAREGVDWFKNDSIQNAFANDWEKQIVKKMTALLYDPVNGLSANYVKDVYGQNPSNAQFQGIEDAFINKQVASIEGSGVVTATVTPEVLPDHTLKPGQAMEMARDVSAKGGNGMIRAALEPLKSEHPANMPSRFQSAWQAAKNAFTNDAVRTAYYEKKVGEYQAQLERRIAALVVVSATGAPTQPTQQAVEAEFARMQAEVQNFALDYTGLDNADAIKKMLLAPAEHANPEWKAASEKVVSYLTNNMKWEKYAILPNPENMAQVLDLWYERVGSIELNGAATGHGITMGNPGKFADYFIWEMQLRLGGHQDYSPEYFYGDVQSVSDTNFKGMITSLRSTVVNYPAWEASPKLRPNTPDMPTSLELLRKNKEKEFNDWFAKYGDCGALFKADHYWPQVQNQSVKDRLAQIIDNPYTTEQQLTQEIDDFKHFVHMERYLVFESLILNRVEADHNGYEIRVRILNQMMNYFYTDPRDLNGYTEKIKEQMRNIMGSQYRFPNYPGIPVA